MRLIELARDLDGVELGLSANRSPAPPPPSGPFAEVDRGELAGAPETRRRRPRSGDRCEFNLDRAIRQKRQLRVGRAGRLEPRTPHHVTVLHRSAAAFAKTRPSPVLGSRSARNGAIRGGPVSSRATLRSVLAWSSSSKVTLPSELTNAVFASFRGEGEAEAHVHLDAVVVGQRRPCAEACPEGAIDPADVVAARHVAGESESEIAEVVGIWRLDQVAFILNDGDLANVDRIGAGGEASRAADPPARDLLSHSASNKRPRGLPSTRSALRLARSPDAGARNGCAPGIP